MNNILITSAGRRVSLVNFFKEELKNIVGKEGKVFTVDIKPELSSACRISDKAFKVVRPTDSGYIEQILHICKTNQIGLVIPTIDTELLALAQFKKDFEKEGIHIICSDMDFIKICRDKRKMNVFFLECGFKLPRYIDRHQPTFPLFIKPVNGSSSQNIFLVKEESMLSDFHVNNMDLLFMEYLPPERYEEYTVDLYYNREGLLKCVVPRVRIAVRGGETNKGITSKNKLIDVVKSKLGSITGAVGCLTLQVFLDKEGEEVYGIEINPRFGGGYPLSYLAGANYPAWIIKEYIRGEKIDWFDGWEDNLLLLRYDQEMIVHDFTY